MRKLFFVQFLLGLLILCASPQVEAATVAEASTGNHKVSVGKYDISDMTLEERKWFLTFLKGNFFVDGWEEISTDILMSTVAHERKEQQVRLDKLGYRIGREWCRANDSRKIDNSMLKKWGRQLKDAAEEEPHLLSEVLQRIDQEVAELLN